MDLIENIRRLKEVKKEVQGKNSQISQANKRDGKDDKKTQKDRGKNFQGASEKGQSMPVKQKQKNESQKINEISFNCLFRGLVFCFPLYNVELTSIRAKAIRSTIIKHQGVVYEMEELQELIEELEDKEDGAISVDFMLVDPKILRETIEESIPSKIKYRAIVDFNFIFHCISQKRILNYLEFLVPQKSKELQNYIKVKEAEKLLEIENRNQERFATRYGAGIQPIDSSKIIKAPGQIVHSSNEKAIAPKPVSKPRSFNKSIYESFEKLSQLFEKTDRGRSISYSRIAMIVKTVKFDITREEDADRLKGMRFIGPKTIEKIKEFIQNGSIEKLNVMEGKEENLVCQKLEKVWGIGKIKALQLYQKGMKTVEDLRELAQNDPNAFTKNQKIGLKYYEDLNQRIPRDKVTRIFEYIKSILFKVAGTENDHKIEVCGSYRRGKETCGDVDVIITRKDGNFETRLVNNLVDELTKQGFLTDHLAMPRHENPKSCISYMGICKFQDQIHHRVDIKYYPIDQYAYAILYFTGSDVFNRNMRLYAMKNGYCLSDHGMWKAEKIGANIVTQEPGIQCFTEEEIFEKLGIKFKQPWERCL